MKRSIDRLIEESLFDCFLFTFYHFQSLTLILSYISSLISIQSFSFSLCLSLSLSLCPSLYVSFSLSLALLLSLSLSLSIFHSLSKSLSLSLSQSLSALLFLLNSQAISLNFPSHNPYLTPWLTHYLYPSIFLQSYHCRLYLMEGRKQAVSEADPTSLFCCPCHKTWARKGLSDTNSLTEYLQCDLIINK